jgi:DNA-binding MarR family transcriptional regulator
MPVQSTSTSRTTSLPGRSDKARIVEYLRTIARELRSGRRQLEGDSVTSAQLDVLRALQSGRATSINDLAARTFTHQSSVSTIVGRLADEGLVSRISSKTDARRTSISLTNAGRAMLRRSSDSSEQRLLSAMKGLSRDELSEVAGCLEKLSSILARRRD